MAILLCFGIAKRPAATASATGLFLFFLNQLDNSHLGRIALAGAHAHDPGIAAVTAHVFLVHLGEQLVCHVLLGDERQSLTVSGQISSWTA